LTEAFVVAQYSPRPIGDTEARRARRPWERVRRRLQALNDRRPTTDDEGRTTNDAGGV
jgi:hypothetical protein